MNAREFEPGVVVGGMRIVRVLGKGGTSVVFEAEQAGTARSVALKVWRRIDDIARFRHEVDALGRLRHTGIAQVFGCGVDAAPWLALELVDGAREITRFAREEKLGRDAVLEMFGLVCDAVHHAHQRGVVHGDLTPGNVLVDRYGTPKLIDFEAGFEVGDAQARGFRGTLPYASPEQVTSAMTDARSDVFALGVLLFELLLGRLPRIVEAAHDAEIARRIAEEDVVRPRVADRTLPRDLELILLRALDRDPARRYASARAFGDDIARFRRRETIRARPTTTRYRVSMFARRRPFLAASLVTTALLLVVATGSSVVSYAEAARHARLTQHEERLAADARGVAQRENELLQQFSILERIADLRRRADAAWPLHAELPEELDAWLREARTLLERLPDLEARLAQLRESALPVDLDAEAAARARCDDRARVEKSRRALAQIGEILDGTEPGSRRDWFLRERDYHERVVRRYAALVPERYVFTFGEVEDGSDLTPDERRWRHDMLTSVVRQLRGLGAGSVTKLEAWNIRLPFPDAMARRRALCERLREETLESGRAQDLWRRACEHVRAQPVYDGFEFEPVFGLLPLGPDPVSGLSEFVDRTSGDEPERDADTGRLRMAEDSGIVFVLIPGGTATIGAQAQDEVAPRYDPNAQPVEGPVHEVQLEPFLLAKFETTQAQWLRLAGDLPSRHREGRPRLRGTPPPTEIAPVESVSQVDALRTLMRFGMSLPTEAQWENACRAGQDSPWHTGSDASSLAPAANLRDRAYGRASRRDDVEDWDDGHALPAAVGSFRPNGLGLHDMHGNVAEWLRDRSRRNRPYAGRGSSISTSLANVVVRGGSSSDRARRARASFRTWQAADSGSASVGFRAAKGLR